MVGFLLDVHVRRATGGARSLDDVMRLAWERFTPERGFAPAEFEALASEVAGEDLAPFFDRAVRGTEELDLAPALEWLGLRAVDDPAAAAPAPPDPEGERASGSTPTAAAAPSLGPLQADASAQAPTPAIAEPSASPGEKPGWLGMLTRIDGGRLVVAEVRRGTPAFDAGLDVEDELIAMDDLRVPPDRLLERLAAYRPGDEVSLLVARRERLLRLEAVLGEDPGDGWRLAPDPGATEEQRARLTEWLAE
jgi:predicted metalloprotease with PDZ domain